MAEALSRDASTQPRFYGQLKFTPSKELDSHIRDFYRLDLREGMAKRALYLFSNTHLEYAALSGREGAEERVALARLERTLLPHMNDQHSLAEGLIVRKHRKGPNSPAHAISLNMGVVLDAYSARAVAPIFGIGSNDTLQTHHLIPVESVIEDDDAFQEACRNLADATRLHSLASKVVRIQVSINHKKH